MKIVYCLDSLIPSGGTERVATTKMNWLSEHPEHQVWVVTLKEDGMPFFFLNQHVTRVMLDINPGDKKRYRAALSQVLNEIKPDVAIAVAGLSIDVLPSIHDGSKKVMEFHFTKNFLVNFVNGMRNDRLHYLRLAKMYYLQWQLARKARRFDCFVGLTKRDVQLWGNPKNMTYIYNPLSFRSAKKSTCENKNIIAVGSWTPAKGMDQLLEAFGPIAHQYPDWTVDLYGAGQDEQLLKEIIKKYGMERQVHMHAPCKNIGEKLVEASIYAFPSRTDGFGLVITEAMECGLPTVAMDCECGPREIVTERTGIIVADRDILAFRKALSLLIDGENLRKELGRNATKDVYRFYCDNIMAQWVNLFNQLKNN